MKYTTTTLAEISKNNPRMCLSAKRALKLCWQCKLYPTCESKIINEFYDADMEKAQILNIEHSKKIRAIKRRWKLK